VARVESTGAWVVDGRVCGVLAVSRAFGDPEFKVRRGGAGASGVQGTDIFELSEDAGVEAWLKRPASASPGGDEFHAPKQGVCGGR
jgi:hypothetical protein